MAKLIFLLALLAQVVWFSHDFLEFTLWAPGCIICSAGFLLDRRAFLSGNMLFWTVSILLYLVAPASQYSRHYFLGEISVMGIRFSDTTILKAVLACDLFLFSYLVTYFLLAPVRSAMHPLSADALPSRSRVEGQEAGRPARLTDAAREGGVSGQTAGRPPGRFPSQDGRASRGAADGEPVVILGLHAADEGSLLGRPEPLPRDARGDEEPIVIVGLATMDAPSMHGALGDGSNSSIHVAGRQLHSIKIASDHLGVSDDEPFVILDLATSDASIEHGAPGDRSCASIGARQRPQFGATPMPARRVTIEDDEPLVILDLAADTRRSRSCAPDAEPVVVLDLAAPASRQPPAPAAAPAQATMVATPEAPTPRPPQTSAGPQPFFVRPEFIGMLVLADLVLLAFCWRLTGSFDFILNGRSYAVRALEDNSALGVFLNYFLQCSQIAFVSACIERYRRLRTLSSLMSLGVVTACALLFMNPLNSTRFVMAGAGLTWLFFWWRGRVNISVYCMTLAVFLIAGMPILNVLRFGLSGLGIAGGDRVRLMLDYNQLDYDCFSMHVFAVQQTSLNGYTYGDNLVATLLFFVPREIWPDKPLPSSLRLGENLVEHHSGWFYNLSCPPFSDMYMDFGMFGAVAAGVIIAYAMRAADRVIDSWPLQSFLRRGIALSFIAFVPILLRGSAAAVIGALWLGMLMFLAVSIAFRNSARTGAPYRPNLDRQRATAAAAR